MEDYDVYYSTGGGLTETFKVEWGDTTSYGSDTTTSTTVSSYPITLLNLSTLYYIRVSTVTSARVSSEQVKEAIDYVAT
jgi:hypothetical protein